MRWITIEGDLPGTSGGGDGWHPTSHATPLFSQIGQSSKTFNPKFISFLEPLKLDTMLSEVTKPISVEVLIYSTKSPVLIKDCFIISVSSRTASFNKTRF